MNIKNYNFICPILEGREQVKLWLKQMEVFAKVVEEMTMQDLREAEKEESKNFNLREWESEVKNKLS